MLLQAKQVLTIFVFLYTMEYLAYFAAIIMGILLGLIGGGGSILTLPVLVYLLHIPSTAATSYSLFIVGLTAFIGAAYYIRYNFICWKSMLFFGLPSLSATYFMRVNILPSFPDSFSILGAEISKDFFVLILFAVLILAASVSMIRPVKVFHRLENPETKPYRYIFILLAGIIVGSIVGMLGAGGGFLIIPTLVILANLPMKKAIGTSLGLIFINCTIGFGGDLIHNVHPNWNLLLIFSAFAIGGMGIGLWLSRFISGSKLKPAFGWFIMIIGIFILVKEYFIHRYS